MSGSGLVTRVSPQFWADKNKKLIAAGLFTAIGVGLGWMLARKAFK